MSTSAPFPLVSIVGTTATGKTGLALAVAERLCALKHYAAVHLVSADSRQVYADLPLLTGADIPENFTPVPSGVGEHVCFAHPTQPLFLHGVSMLAATQEWSVALFREYVLSLLVSAREKNHAVLLVGGTGLYHAQVLTVDPESSVPPNPEWRAQAAVASVAELQELLQELSPKKYAALNNSDRHNSRRLQRAIEIAKANPGPLPAWQLELAAQYTQQFFGLTLPDDVLHQRIVQRVDTRIKQGVYAEVAEYLSKYSLDTPAGSSLGLALIAEQLGGVLSEQEMRSAWITAELQYARRQRVWWKKQQDIVWLASAEPTVVLDALHTHLPR